MKRVTWINLILGLWLIVAPFAIGYAALSRTAVTEDVVLGVLIAAFSWWILAAMTPPVGTSWFQILCGIWVIIAPFVLLYRNIAAAMFNDVAVGIVVLIVAIVESRAIVRIPGAA